MAKKKVKRSPAGAAFLWKALLIVLVVATIGLFTLITLVRKNVFGDLPTTEELAALRSEEATLILSSNSAVIGKVFAKDRTNVRFKDLPQHLIDALVSTEDQRFFEHEGVDARSYVRVLFRTVMAGDASGGGGSTISQQLIKNLYGRERHGPLTIPVNKIKEALVAQRLEQVYSKEDVLTLYLNSVPFGENMYGVEAASERYFSKSVTKLKVEEAALLVGMLKANTSYNPRLHPKASKDRRDQVLALMAGNGKLSSARRDSLQALPLRIRYSGVDALDAYGYFTARVEREARDILVALSKKNGRQYDIEKDGLHIHTTLDTALQQIALRSIRTQLMVMQPKLDHELNVRKTRATWEKQLRPKDPTAWKRNDREVRDVFTWVDAAADTLSYRDSLWHYQRMLNAAVLMMEPASGKVRVWIGGNDHRFLPFDQVESHRPIASTIKPIIYAAALRRGLEPCTYLNNTKKTYADYEDWTPENFDRDTIGGQVAMWYALAHSMNIPTVDLYFRTGVDTIRDMFKALDLPTDRVAKPALALGAADISLKEIVRAYGAFAAMGRMPEPQMIESITDAQGQVIYTDKGGRGKYAIDEALAQTISAMLRRVVDQGTAASMRSRFGIRAPLAGKTGTSQDFSDAWFVAYTPGLVMGTWVGARDPAVHFHSGNGTGSQLALPIIGGALVSIERSPSLRKSYLLPFTEPDSLVDMSCDPRRSETLVGRLLDGLFGNDSSKVKQRSDTTHKGFFERLFKKDP